MRADDHPTTQVELDEYQNSSLETISGVVRHDEEEDRYELIGLEYDDTLIRGDSAPELYATDREQLYEDKFGNDALDTGEVTWEEAKNALD